MRRTIISLATLSLSAALRAQESPEAQSLRYDADNRKMLWLAFGLYGAVLGGYLLWTELRLRRLEKKAGG